MVFLLVIQKSFAEQPLDGRQKETYAGRELTKGLLVDLKLVLTGLSFRTVFSYFLLV